MKKKENNSIVINYNTGVVALPANIIAHLEKASKFDIKVLMLMTSSEKYREGKYILEITKALICEAKDVESSIAFWRGTGIVSVIEEETAVESKTEKITPTMKIAPKRAKVSDLPQYTSTELNALLKKHKNMVGLIDESQNLLGKIFTVAEINILVGLVDYLGMDNSYILVLMDYCSRNNIKAMRQIEKIAISCFDEGIVEASKLEEALQLKEEKASYEGKIRGMFGIGSRTLISKEKKQIDAWKNVYKFDIDVVQKAYEITITNTKEPSINYANAILEKWHAAGIKNIDGVNELLAKRELERGGEGSSFNVDEFFQAALDRSYEKM